MSIESQKIADEMQTETYKCPECGELSDKTIAHDTNKCDACGAPYQGKEEV